MHLALTASSLALAMIINIHATRIKNGTAFMCTQKPGTRLAF